VAGEALHRVLSAGVPIDHRRRMSGTCRPSHADGRPRGPAAVLLQAEDPVALHLYISQERHGGHKRQQDSWTTEAKKISGRRCASGKS
jgi:hypothetical protein